MEALSRLVAESLARHGLDRPADPRRLQWSRWVRCDSPRSLLVVPSKPGIFALADDIVGLPTHHVGADARACPERAQRAEWAHPDERSLTTPPEAGSSRLAGALMLAVFHFAEDDDMAFTLDRLFTRPNPLRNRLAKGNCFLRFVVIRDQTQRRHICNALKQWQAACAERASGIGADFDSSSELFSRVGLANASTDAVASQMKLPDLVVPSIESEAGANIRSPQPFPSGF
jgi:hypothetical protein